VRMNVILTRRGLISRHTDRRCRGSGRGRRLAGLVWVAALSAGFALTPPAQAWQQEVPLCANIGWSTTSADGPWYTAAAFEVSKDTTIYFHALNPAPGNTPKTNDEDPDLVNGQMKNDTAIYRWDWNYKPGDGDMGNTGGLSFSKSYDDAGNRVVRLYVYDNDGAGYTNDANVADTVTVKVKLTLETDWMTGQDPYCVAADHAIYHTDLAAAWVPANYTLGIDEDHQENCTHYPYIGDVKNDAQIHTYLDGYANEECDLYLMGGHRYRVNDDAAGSAWYDGDEDCVGMVFAFSGGGLTANAKTSTALHENAAHDGTVGALGDDFCGAFCPVNDEGAWAISFCADCIAALKAHQDLED